MTLVGSRGTVTIPIKGPGYPGEVEVSTLSGTRRYIAYCDAPVDRSATVIIYEDRGGMKIDVEPISE